MSRRNYSLCHPRIIEGKAKKKQCCNQSVSKCTSSDSKYSADLVMQGKSEFLRLSSLKSIMEKKKNCVCSVITQMLQHWQAFISMYNNLTLLELVTRKLEEKYAGGL